MSPITLHKESLRVACLGAHPDDIEIACGGTLLTLARRHQLTARYLIMTGSPERRKEALAAAEAFLPNAEVEFGCEQTQFIDGFLPQAWGAVKRRMHQFAEEMMTPDIVFVPRVDDAHQDHRLLGQLAPTIWRNSQIFHYEIPKWDGDVGRPALYVPVADVDAHTKVRLLNASYPSQHSRDWWDDELFLGFLRMRGMECKRRYAEAFHINKLVLGL